MKRNFNNVTGIFYRGLIVLSFFLSTTSVLFAAQIYLLPQESSVNVGETFVSEVHVDTQGKNVNAFEIGVTYTSETLKIVDVITGNSIIDLWVRQPSYSNEEGLLVLQGGVIGGFSGDGTVIKILFRTRILGAGNVSFTPSSKVLLHDGRGTPVATIFSPAQYRVVPKATDQITIESNTHPKQDTWYSESSINILWSTSKDSLYSYTFSRDFIQNPDKTPDTPVGEILFSKVLDGIYYFSLRESVDGGNTWSEPVSFKVFQDNAKPKPFDILLDHNEKIFNDRNFVAFTTNDITSGVTQYEIRESHPLWWIGFGKGEWKVINSPYLLSDQELRSIIEVRVTDRANNKRSSVFKTGYVRAVDGIVNIVITIIVIYVVWIFVRKRRRKQ